MSNHYFNDSFFSHLQNDMKYGTMNIDNSYALQSISNNIGEIDLIWHYKQAFQAMAAIEYQHRNNDEIFTSEIIKNLHQMHRNNKLERITPVSFKQINLKSFASMLKHKWIFEDWTNEEIYTAAIYSAQHKNSDESNKFYYLNQVLYLIISMGHVLYPFHVKSFCGSITEKISIPQFILYPKCTGFKNNEMKKKQIKFLENIFEQQDVVKNKYSQNDIEIIAQLLHFTFNQNERSILLQTLWKNTTEYQKNAKDSVIQSDINNRKHWERNISSIIINYM